MPFISIASGGCIDYYTAACLFLSYLVTCNTESGSGQETQMNGKEFIRQCANGMSKRFENGFDVNANANAQITIVIIFPLFLPVSFIGIVVFQSPCVLQMSHCVCLWNWAHSDRCCCGFIKWMCSIVSNEHLVCVVLFFLCHTHATQCTSYDSFGRWSDDVWIGSFAIFTIKSFG